MFANGRHTVCPMSVLLRPMVICTRHHTVRRRARSRVMVSCAPSIRQQHQTLIRASIATMQASIKLQSRLVTHRSLRGAVCIIDHMLCLSHTSTKVPGACSLSSRTSTTCRRGSPSQETTPTPLRPASPRNTTRKCTGIGNNSLLRTRGHYLACQV